MKTDSIYDLIRKFNNDSDVISLKNYYKSTTFMEVLGVTRNELAHSSFLWWLFNDNVNFDLGLKPLMLFLDLLVNKSAEQFPNNEIYISDKEKIVLNEKEKISEDDKKAIILRKANIKIENIKTEHAIDGGRVDLYIQFYIENDEYKKNHYAIILENKVKACEKENKEKNKYQTELYYKYFNKQKSNVKNIYVYLTPALTKNKARAECKKFINITYNNIVDFVIIPLLSDNSLSDKTSFILNDYMKSLSKPIIGRESFNKKNKTISMIKNPELKKSNLDNELDVYDSNTNYGIDKKLIESMNNIRKEYYKKFDEELKKNDEEITAIFDEFIFDELNRLVMASAFPSIFNNRNKNNNFENLNIEEGTTLYFVPNGAGNDIDIKKVARTEDSLNKVSYVDEETKEVRYGSISSIAKIFKGVSYPINGFRYFAIKEGNKYINLNEINKKERKK